MNSVCITGNLTRDIELKYLQSGTAVANFSVALNRSVKKGDEWTKKPVFVDCVVFGKQAEWLADGSKGSPVSVQGEMDMESWEKDGKKFTKTLVLASEVRLTGARSGGGETRHERQPQRQERNNAPPGGDDIPFMWLVGLIVAASQMPWLA